MTGDAFDPAEAVDIDRYLFFWLGHADALWRARLRRTLKPTGLTHPEWRVLTVLSAKGPQTATDLAAITVIERTALSRAVEALAARGMVARSADPADARRQLIAPTPAGVAAHARARAAVAPHYRAALAGVSPAEVEAAIALLRRVALALGGVPPARG